MLYFSVRCAVTTHFLGDFVPKAESVVFKRMPEEKERELFEKFEDYKRNV